MRYATHLLCVAAAVSPLVALAATRGTAPEAIPTDIPQPVDKLPPGMRPATELEMREAMRDLTRNPGPSIEERLRRIEQLSSQLQHEAQALRQDLHPRMPRTQPAGPLPEDERVPNVHFR